MRLRMRTGRRSLTVLLTAGVLAVGLVAVPAAAEDTPPSGYPSWAEVEAAHGNAAAMAAQAEQINTLLDGLQQQADSLGVAAVVAGATSAQTDEDLRTVTTRVEILTAQNERAGQDSEQYRRSAVAVAVQSYKTGSSSLGLLTSLVALSSQDTLDGVDLLHLVGEQAATQQEKAQESQAVAQALTDSLAAARTERAALQASAQVALDDALAARNAVDEQLAAQQTQQATLLSQLATLNSTTVEVESAYRRGQAELAAYESVQAAKGQAAAQEAQRQRELAAAAPPAPIVPVAPAAPAPAAPPPVTTPVAPPAPVAPVTPAPPVAPAPAPAAVNDPAGAQAYAASRLADFGWNQGQFGCLVQLWERESNWRTTATNPSSGAYGIAQSLPASKYASAGADWLTNYRTQVTWGLGYIQERYGSPCAAWAHSEAVGWY